nr:MAG TPA: hypothetical protein [Caudoviricetes sp.]
MNWLDFISPTLIEAKNLVWRRYVKSGVRVSLRLHFFFYLKRRLI